MPQASHAGIGLSIAHLRVELVSRRGRKVKEREKATVQHELHANRLRLEQNHLPATALRLHQGRRPNSIRGEPKEQQDHPPSVQ